MARSFILTVCFVLSLLITSQVHAEVLTIEATVKSVDTKSRSITVERKGKTRDLDVSRKVKINIDGEQSSLDALKAGQQISLSYHTDLEIVLKIEISNTGGGSEVSLFNGTDLQGWKFGTAQNRNLSRKEASRSVHEMWFVDADRNVLVALGKQNCWLETTKKYKDFSLTCDWRFLPNREVTDSGSGIIIRANGRDLSGKNPRGIEIDIVPFSMPMVGSFLLYGAPLETKKGKAMGEENVRLKRIRNPKTKPKGQWNTCEIKCIGDRVTVTMNGVVVNEAWGAKIQPGTICIRNQWSEVEFRNILLKPSESNKGEAK